MTALKKLLEHYEERGKNCPIQTTYWSPAAGIRYIFQKRMSTILNLFDKINDKMVLDIGCGSGAYTLHLSEKGAYVHALDISKNHLLNARNLPKVMKSTNFLCADAQNLPFRSGAFDCTLCTEVTEHVINPMKLLNEIKRTLKTDGTCIISVPSKYSPTEILRKAIYGARYNHLHFWSVREFKKILRTKIIKNRHCIFLSYFLRNLLSDYPFLIPLVNVIEDVFARVPLLRNFGWCVVFKCIKSSNS